MKNWFGNNNNELGLIYVLILLIMLGVIATSFTACIMYGEKPVTEIPAWAILFMFGGRGGR